MKKIFVFLIMACLSLCACQTQFGLAYGVKLSGDGDGKFEVTFPQGIYAMDGTAAIVLNVGDTIPFGKVTTKAEVIERGDANQLAALKEANELIAEKFGASSGGGSYDIWLQGFVKEIGTGLVFKVDRHFTNREKPKRAQSAYSKPRDPYPYIE